MKRIFLDCYGGNVIAALAEDKKLLEYQTEKVGGRVVVGSVYKGRVENVLNGMQAAFVNIGLEKNGYLYTGDTLVDKSQLDGAINFPTKLDLKVGDEIIVQVIKDASGTKGVRLTTHISFASRNLVYMPEYDFVVVSRRITDEGVRQRLFDFASAIKPQKGGLIVRTAGKDCADEIFIEEKQYLESLYRDIQTQAETAPSCSLLYEDGSLAKRMLRDVYSLDIDEIIAADYSLYTDVMDVASRRGGGMRKKVKYHKEKVDLLGKYGLSVEVDKMLRNKVALSSGAYIIIDRTEALTAIDVNTGKYIGDNSLEATVYQTNLIAADEIARQLRLRNIGGIVIIDFIDMEEEAHRLAVVERLKEALKDDRSRCNVIGMTGLGLVELTRKKTRKETAASLNKNCPYCRGEGVIFSNDYIVMKLRCALLDLFSGDYSSAIVELNTEICEYIFRSNALSRDVSKVWRDKRIYLVPHRTYHQEFFIVKGENSKVLDLPDTAKLLY